MRTFWHNKKFRSVTKPSRNPEICCFCYNYPGLPYILFNIATYIQEHTRPCSHQHKRSFAFISAAVTGLRENDSCDEENELRYCGDGLVCYKLQNETKTKCITRNMYIKLTCVVSKCFFLGLLLTDLTSNT